MEPPYKKIKLEGVFEGNEGNKIVKIYKSVDELRNEFVNYTDTTPNEPRWNKNNKLTTFIFYPFGNIYPYGKLPILSYEDKIVDRDYFCITLYNNQIQYAIQYLQPKALKKILTRNFKNHLFQNPFRYLVRTFYPVNKNLEAAIEIIKILIDNYDDYVELIKELYCPVESEQKYVLDILYTFLPNN
jgi:hypothetical protein